MPYIDAQPVPLPFTGRSQRTRSNSLKGAQLAVVKAGSQASRMLLEYAQADCTDLEMAAKLGLPESRISARRSGLVIKGLVRYAGYDVTGPSGALNAKWMLTVYGRNTVEGMR